MKATLRCNLRSNPGSCLLLKLDDLTRNLWSPGPPLADPARHVGLVLRVLAATDFAESPPAKQRMVGLAATDLSESPPASVFELSPDL